MPILRRILLALAASAGLLVAGCPSPAQDAIIESLGPEVDGVEPGEFHRPGQPCLRCHGGYGPGDPVFSVAGTVFATPDEKIPVAGVQVLVTDAAGESRRLESNCVGNFLITEDEWFPVYPLATEILCTNPDGTLERSVMNSRINRDGACAGCHFDQPALNTVGWVYCRTTQPEPPYVTDPSCPGVVP